MATSQKLKFPFFRRRPHDENQETDYGDHSSELVKIVLFFSIVTAGTGFWACFQCNDPFVLEAGISHYKYPGKTLMFTGAVLIATSIVSILEAGKFMRISAVCVIRALGCILLIEAVAGSTAVALTYSISTGFFNQSLLKSLKESYNTDRLVKWSTNEIQKTFHCCGVDGPADWNNSSWSKDNVEEAHMHYPSSCCKEGGLCNERKVYKKGCGFEASETLYNRLFWTYICAFSSMFIHLTSFLMLSVLEYKM